MFRKLLALMALFLATPLHAEWREASSRNFIVYTEGPEAAAREFATKLEKFNFLLRAYHGVTTPSSPNKLRVFLLSTIEAVGRMAGSPGVAGYYVPWSRGAMLVGTRYESSNARLKSETILLHEYTHHFMYQYFPATYPTWYSEGFAEFWGETRILDNNVFEIGHAANHRYLSFAGNRWLPIDRLLRAQSYADVGGDIDLLYAQGWLLARYVFDQPERRKQLQVYLDLIQAGQTYEQAMTKAFGPNAGSLNSALFNYAGRNRLTAIRLPFRPIDVGPIEVRALRPAEQALISHEIRLSQGILQRDAAKFADEIRDVAARYPDDPFALRLVMESSRLAGRDAAAAEAAERLLKVEPQHARAQVTKALLALKALEASNNNSEPLWDAQRQLIASAARKAPTDPVVLEAFYDSYAMRSGVPPAAAQSALYSAMELAPSDSSLRYRVAKDFEDRGMIREAITVIRPDAYRVPHREDETEREKRRRLNLEERYRRAGTTRRESAREMLTRLEAKLREAPRVATPAS